MLRRLRQKPHQFETSLGYVVRSYLKNNKRTGEIGLVVECLPNMHIPSTTEKDKERRERRAAGRERKKDTYRSTQMGKLPCPRDKKQYCL